MTPARATMAKYVCACVVVVGSAIAGIAAEPPASGDLFDIARGTTVTTHSAVESSIIESIFGATGFPCFCPSGPPLLHNFLLQCLPEGGAVKEVEKTTDPCP
jgi:hypothetical protein